MLVLGRCFAFAVRVLRSAGSGSVPGVSGVPVVVRSVVDVAHGLDSVVRLGCATLADCHASVDTPGARSADTDL